MNQGKAVATVVNGGKRVGDLILYTDNKWKDFVYGIDVPKRVLKDFDHVEDAESSYGFFKYKKEWYHTSQFVRLPSGSELNKDWDGVDNWSWSNGLLIKLSRDGEQYKVAYFYVSKEH